MANPIKFQTFKSFCGSCGETVVKYAKLKNGTLVKFDVFANLEDLGPGPDFIFLGEGVLYSLGNNLVKSTVHRYFWRKKNDRSNN